MEGKIFLWYQKAATINKTMAYLSEQLQGIIVSLTIKNEQSVERNNNDICNPWLSALLYLKHILLAFVDFRIKLVHYRMLLKCKEDNCSI